MGGDGGTLALNRKFLSHGHKPSAEALRAQARAQAAEKGREQYSNCSLSGEPLREPVACCAVGFLYNKEAVLQRLLDGPPMEAPFAHLTGLKALTTCALTPNPTFSAAASAGASSTATYAADPTAAPAPFVCALTGIEMNGKLPFCCLKETGAVVSVKATVEVPDTVKGMTVIRLFPSDEERAVILLRLEQEAKDKKRIKDKKKKQKQKKKKDKKKGKEKEVEDEEDEEEEEEEEEANVEAKDDTKKRKLDADGSDADAKRRSVGHEAGK